MADREKFEDEIYYGVTVDLRHTPTVWSQYFADARSQALDMRVNPLWKDKPIYIIEKTEHYEIADCYYADVRKAERGLPDRGDVIRALECCALGDCDRCPHTEERCTNHLCADALVLLKEGNKHE